jgi:polysaccharide deacetylase family protein (PEP-CTERM system associated)
MIRNALSVDLEEYYHGMEFEAAVGRERFPQLPSRVEWNASRVLDVLERNGVRATFFALGAVAEAHPRLVQRIAAAGHEIGCHGYAHELVSRQAPETFRAEVRRVKALLEDLTGEPVFGFRAPNYSIGHEQVWAYDILLEEGFVYDSSVYPIHHDRYGDPQAPRFPYPIAKHDGRGLTEFPIGTLRMAGVNWPIGGGGYFRLLPTVLFELALRRVNRLEGRGVMFYVHPWELDAGQPRPPMPLHHRFRHYVNLGMRYEQKLEQLVRSVPFAPAREVLGLSVAPLPRRAPAPRATVPAPALDADLREPVAAAPAAPEGRTWQ